MTAVSQVQSHPASVEAYIRHGWSLVPIPPGTKGPRTAGWNQRTAALRPGALPHGWGIGLAHAYSGTMALDIDAWDRAVAELATHGIDLPALYAAPDAVVIDSGRQGHGKLLYTTPFGLALPSKRVTRDGVTVFELRWAVDETVDAQMILIEAHDIIGAANAVLKLVEVDKFTDMDQLEAIYQVRCKAWTCIADTGSIKRQLLSSKLVNSKIAAWSGQFTNVRKTYEYLFAHIDEKVILNQIQVQISDLNPKMELSSYLAAATLRPRHWKFMGEKAFANCGMTLKFSGRNSEFVSVVDNSSKEAIGLGNINRLDINELVKRYVKAQRANICTSTNFVFVFFSVLELGFISLFRLELSE